MKFWMLLLMLVISVPAFGRDPDILRAVGPVVVNSSTTSRQISQRGMNTVNHVSTEAPFFRCSKPEKLFVRISRSSSSRREFNGITTDRIAEVVQEKVAAIVLSMSRGRNIRVMDDGTPCENDLVIRGSITVMFGTDFSKSHASSSFSQSWRRSSERSSSREQDKSESTGVYVVLEGLRLVRLGRGDQAETIAAPVDIYSFSDSQRTYGSEESSYSRSESHSGRYGGSHSRSEQSGYEWGNDKDMAKIQMIVPALNVLSNRATEAIFWEWHKYWEGEQYNQNEDRAAACREEPQIQPPAKPVKEPFRYSITKE